MINTTEALFSYGTLQNAPVQLETFGRELEGFADVLLGYQLEMVEIEDAQVVLLSGKTHHPIAVLSVDKSAEIKGAVFKITQQELARSDKYEVDAYQRVLGQFKSGKKAWVYVSAKTL